MTPPLKLQKRPRFTSVNWVNNIFLQETAKSDDRQSLSLEEDEQKDVQIIILHSTKSWHTLKGSSQTCLGFVERSLSVRPCLQKMLKLHKTYLDHLELEVFYVRLLPQPTTAG